MEGEGIGENPYCVPHSELAEKKKTLHVDELRKTHLWLKMLFNMIT